VTTPLHGETGGLPSELDGILVVDKPEGPTSHDVVACARRALATRQVGHTGTLDPMATGVLALVVGRATRLAQFLGFHEKAYEAVFRLGVETDTWDRTGATVKTSEAPLPGRAEVDGVLAALLGRHDQVPPPFSAKKVGGVRAYKLARQGKAVEVPPASVTLLSAALSRFEPPLVRLQLTCSAGYYVRALAHEVGIHLGCGACLESLRRTSSGSFTLADSVPLRLLEEAPADAAARLVPMASALPDLPAVVLTAQESVRAFHGNEIRPSDWVDRNGTVEAAAVRLLDPEGRLVAIARPGREPGVLHPAVVLR
jgi:tRNA pseudouridine55 synthase